MSQPAADRADCDRQVEYITADHCGMVLTPTQVERTFREQDVGDAERFLEVGTHKALWNDLLLVTDVKAHTLRECRLY